jgi:hypothetical protein
MYAGGVSLNDIWSFSHLHRNFALTSSFHLRFASNFVYYVHIYYMYMIVVVTLVECLIIVMFCAV